MADVNEKDTNNNNNEALTIDNEPTDNITEEEMMQLKQKLHDFVRQEFKRRFPKNSKAPQNSGNSEDPQNSEYSQNSENSDSSAPSDFSAPSSGSASRRRLVPAPKTQHTPFYKALNLKKTHNKRRKRR